VADPEMDIDPEVEPADVEVLDNQGVEDESEFPFYTITSYGADYPVDGLVKRIAEGSIVIPQFQRGYVWSIKQASRFIESLLLGLPVPGIFLSREKDTQKLLVIDGQQRLRTLHYFYDGVFAPTDKAFSLQKVQKGFTGATYKKLSDEDKRRLDDSILHATIVHQEVPSEDDSSIYQIFERLNTGGVRLSPQEIRTCIYHGALAELLHALNAKDSWRAIYGPISRRMRDQEMILRFLALYFGGPYQEFMAEFVNRYMGSNRNLAKQSAKEITDVFDVTIDQVHEALGKTAFRPKGTFNAAVFDAVMVGLARRLAQGKVADPEQVRQRYDDLLKVDAFVAATETGTAHQDSVDRRLDLATGAFADLQ
jgi:hypothetical protein